MEWKVPNVSFSDSQLKRLFPLDPWPHQLQGTRGIIECLNTLPAVSFCSPTGGGKSFVIQSLLKLASAYGMSSVVYTNRKLLTRQMSKGLIDSGVEHGVRAASMPFMQDLSKEIQISSIQTEISRCIQGDQALHRASLVIVDEAHMYGNGENLRVIQQHLSQGAKVVLVSATPMGLNHIAPKLVVGGTNSELLACNSHVPAIVKGMDQMDLTKVRRVQGKFDYKSLQKNAWSQAIVGKVLERFLEFNPGHRCTLGVAPGVPESRALAQHFYRHGIRAAHVDATEVFIDGVYYRDNALGDRRNEVVEKWRNGEIDVVWSCQVFREAFDLPRLYHLILATPMGSLKDYIQQVGRVIRYSDETPDHVLVTDHGGNIWRHGHPNEDRDWQALYNLPEKEIREREAERRNEEIEKEEADAVCPKCGTVLKFGQCPPAPLGCGEDIKKTNPKRLRYVVQEDGNLQTIDPKKVKKRQGKDISIEQRQWNSVYFAGKNSKKKLTFNQIKVWYKRKFGTYPPKGLTFMPKAESDWSRRVDAVSRSRLG